ncbi:MAG: hypothetical protein QXH87_03470 [Candidatus Bathyarchaeia archaeon]
MEELAKKYGYAHKQRIHELIEIYEYRDEILQRLNVTTGSNKVVSWKKALRILKQLKTEEKLLCIVTTVSYNKALRVLKQLKTEEKQYAKSLVHCAPIIDCLKQHGYPMHRVISWIYCAQYIME